MIELKALPTSKGEFGRTTGYLKAVEVAPIESIVGGLRESSPLVRSADRAPGFGVLRRGKGLPPLAPHPHPRVWPPTSASLRMVCLDEVEQFAENQNAGVALLRWCSPSARNGVALSRWAAVRDVERRRSSTW